MSTNSPLPAMRACLSQQHPVAALRACVVQLHADGMTRDAIYSACLELQSLLEAEGKLLECDHLFDVMDMLTGYYVSQNIDLD